MANMVSFKFYELKETFNSSEKDENTISFVKETNEIYKGDTRYSKEYFEDIGIKNFISDSGESNKFKIFELIGILSYILDSSSNSYEIINDEKIIVYPVYIDETLVLYDDISTSGELNIYLKLQPFYNENIKIKSFNFILPKKSILLFKIDPQQQIFTIKSVLNSNQELNINGPYYHSNKTELTEEEIKKLLPEDNILKGEMEIIYNKASKGYSSIYINNLNNNLNILNNNLQTRSPHIENGFGLSLKNIEENDIVTSRKISFDAFYPISNDCNSHSEFITIINEIAKKSSYGIITENELTFNLGKSSIYEKPLYNPESTDNLIFKFKKGDLIKVYNNYNNEDSYLIIVDGRRRIIENQEYNAFNSGSSDFIILTSSDYEGISAFSNYYNYNNIFLFIQKYSSLKTDDIISYQYLFDESGNIDMTKGDTISLNKFNVNILNNEFADDIKINGFSIQENANINKEIIKTTPVILQIIYNKESVTFNGWYTNENESPVLLSNEELFVFTPEKDIEIYPVLVEKV